MDKLELIINDHYYNYQFLELSEFYANLYSEKTDDKNKEKLLYLFAVLQNRLEIDLRELNRRIQTIDKHYRADDSRELLGIINTIDSLLFSLKTSKYEFSINEVYYAFLQEAKTYLKTSNGSQIPENIQPIQVVSYERIFMFTNEGNFISPEEEIDKILTLVSTRNASFDQMADEEKLQNLNIAIEFMLKEKKKFISFDYDKAFSGFVSEQNIIDYRKITQCFRHASKENIEERQKFTSKQKRFLANYGLTLCMTILNEKNHN